MQCSICERLGDGKSMWVCESCGSAPICQECYDRCSSDGWSTYSCRCLSPRYALRFEAGVAGDEDVGWPAIDHRFYKWLTSDDEDDTPLL